MTDKTSEQVEKMLNHISDKFGINPMYFYIDEKGKLKIDPDYEIEDCGKYIIINGELAIDKERFEEFRKEVEKTASELLREL